MSNEKLSAIHLHRESALNQSANFIKNAIFVHNLNKFEFHALRSNHSNRVLIFITLKLYLRGDKAKMVGVLRHKILTNVRGEMFCRGSHTAFIVSRIARIDKFL